MAIPARWQTKVDAPYPRGADQPGSANVAESAIAGGIPVGDLRVVCGIMEAPVCIEPRPRHLAELGRGWPGTNVRVAPRTEERYNRS